MKCLIIEDDFDSRRVMQKMLHPYAYVDVATDGEEGVAAFLGALRDNEPYDLITLDLIMPNSDGQQALRNQNPSPPTAQKGRSIVVHQGSPEKLKNVGQSCQGEQADAGQVDLLIGHPGLERSGGGQQRQSR